MTSKPSKKFFTLTFFILEKTGLPSHPNISQERVSELEDSEDEEIQKSSFENYSDRNSDDSEERMQLLPHPNMQYFRDPQIRERYQPQRNYFDHPNVKFDRNKMYGDTTQRFTAPLVIGQAALRHVDLTSE